MTYIMHNNYSVYDSLPCGAVVFRTDSKLSIVYSNDMYSSMFGSELIRVNDEDREFIRRFIANADMSECIYFMLIDKNDNPVNVRAFVRKIGENEAFAIVIDESRLVNAINELDIKCTRYETVINGTDEIFFEYNKQTDVMTVFFSSGDSVLMHNISNFEKRLNESRYVLPEDTASVKNVIDAGVTDEKTIDIHLRKDTDTDFEWYRVLVKPDKRDSVLIGSIRNINDTKKEEERLKEKALIDPLSKVYNRSAAVELIKECLRRRDEAHACALVVLDIDNFKRINDTYGHLYGDAVIAMAAGSIKSTLDDNDIMGRFGGDEFFVFIDDANKDLLEKKLENIRQAILKMRLDKDDDKDISCSLGVAQGDGTSTYEELFRKADSALYLAKENGKNRFEYFNGVYCDEAALSYARSDDKDESNAEYNLITVALEIASKSKNTENAIINIMRHVGVTLDLNCIQIMRYDTIEDAVSLEQQWWREFNGDYNVVFTNRKSGYYQHNDLMLFKQRFEKDHIFRYTPDFKQGFSQKYADVFDASKDSAIVYASNNENDRIFFSVTFIDFDKEREFTDKEYSDMFEVTKILSMYLKSSSEITQREKMLMNNLDYDWTGVYTMPKLTNEVSRIGREAHTAGEMLAFVCFDIKNMYKINLEIGRMIGDDVIMSLAVPLQNGNGGRCICGRIAHDDTFLVCMRCPDIDYAVDFANKKIKDAEKRIAAHTDYPVVIKAAAAVLRPGEYFTNAVDAVRRAVRDNDYEKSDCIKVNSYRTEFLPGQMYKSAGDRYKRNETKK